MKVLVTGSEGSLMQAVIQELSAAGHDLRGADNFFRYGVVERPRSYEFIQGDLCDEGIVNRAVQGVDIVIQGAARIFGVSGFHKYPADILAHDINLHQNVLWAALAHKVSRVVYISSSMVYERSQHVPSVEEDVEDMQVPYTDYGLSKLVGERLCRAFQLQYGLPFTIWRPFNIITPFEKGEDDPGVSHVFADFIRRIVVERENPMRILGDGQQVRCFTWIEDVAKAIAKNIDSTETKNEIFNLGNPEPTTMLQLAQFIYQQAVALGLVRDLGELKFSHLPAFRDDVRTRIPSITKATKHLGWSPTVKLQQALRNCLDATAREMPVAAEYGASAAR